VREKDRKEGKRERGRTMIMRTRPVTKPGSLCSLRTTSSVLERLIKAERAS